MSKTLMISILMGLMLAACSSEQSVPLQASFCEEQQRRAEKSGNYNGIYYCETFDGKQSGKLNFSGKWSPMKENL